MVKLSCLLCAAALVLAGCNATYGTVEIDGQRVAKGDAEGPIALDAVPAAVTDAAIAEVPGLNIESAAREVERGKLLYELSGTVDGTPCEVEVTADGKVVEVEKGADDDGEDDADDDDDGPGDGD